jgi:predicted nucleic acid-binding Zn ribbon protein
VLAEWRGIDLDPLEKAFKPVAKSSADLMPQVLSRLNLDLRRSETEILKAWNHLVDPNITAHARPTGWRRGTLFVSVDNSVWLSEIVRYRQREILNRLQYCFGRDLITRISFRIG